MRLSSPLKIAIVGTNNDKMYSGGRYHALILAYALARTGADVSLITNKAPRFIEDLDPLAPGGVTYVYTPDFRENMPQDEYDFVVLVPTGIYLPQFYEAAFDFARGAHARMALINFESGNWFNAVAPVPRDIRLWDYWRRAVATGGLVISSLRVSDSHARDFYGAVDPDTLRFEVCGPPINSPAADRARGVAKDGSVVSFVRSTDVHKGGGDLLRIDPQILSRRTLRIISGGDHDPDYMAALQRHFRSARVELEFLSAVSDVEKFQYIGMAQALLFPTRFEGFGYPPVEAAYMGTEVACYDLPALRETVGGIAHMAPVGDIDAFGQALAAALAAPRRREELHTHVADLVGIDAVGYRISDILYRSLEQVPILPKSAGELSWGPFNDADADADVQTYPVLPAIAQGFRRTQWGEYLLSVTLGCAQIPASVDLDGDAAATLEDVCIEHLGARGDGHIVAVTGRLAELPASGVALNLQLRDMAGEILQTLPLKLEAPANEESGGAASLSMTGLWSEEAGSRVDFKVDKASRIAISADGVSWTAVPVEDGLAQVRLDEALPQRSGMRIYLFRDREVVDYYAGCPPLPGPQPLFDAQRAIDNCRIEIMNLTDVNWDRGLYRNPILPLVTVIGCVRPERLPEPGDVVRLGSGRLITVRQVEDKGRTVNLHFHEGVDAQTDAWPARLTMVARANPASDAIAGGGWTDGVWIGQGPLSGRCLLLPDEAIAAVGGAVDQMAILGPDGEEIAVDAVSAAAQHQIAWLSRPIRRDAKPGAFIRSSVAAGLGFVDRGAETSGPPSSAWIAADGVGRVVTMRREADVSPGDVLVFGGDEIRAVQAVEKTADRTWVLFDLAISAPEGPIRFATVQERASFPSRQLAFPSLLMAPGHGKLADLAESYRRSQHVAAVAPIDDRPRVLFASVVPPDPADQGNRIVTRNFLRHLVSLGFDVDLLLLGRIAPERLYKEFGDRVRVFSWPFPDWTKEPTVPVRRKIAEDLRQAAPEVMASPQFARMLRDVLTFHPFFIVPDPLMRIARALYRKHDYHAIVCNYTHMVRVAAELAPIRSLPPVAIVTHDALSRLPLESGGKPLDTMYRLCSPEVERAVLDTVPGAVVLAISESERDYFRAIGVQNAVELCEYDGLLECDIYRVPPAAFASRRLLFHASGNPMNRAAIDWFIDNCWAAVRRAVPDATLVLCGAICDHVDGDTPGVEMHGIVPRDRLMELVGTSSVAINPTLAGTGLKIKTVEAICAGVPSVCLPAAVEGLEEVADRFCALEEEPEGFAAACIRLLIDQPHWNTMRESALALAAERFSAATIYGPVDRHMGWDRDIEVRHASPRDPYGFPPADELDDIVASLPAADSGMRQTITSLLAMGEVGMASRLLRKMQDAVRGDDPRLARMSADLALAADDLQDARHLTMAAIAADPSDPAALVRLIDIAIKLSDRVLAREAWEHLALALPGCPGTIGLTALPELEGLRDRAILWATRPVGVVTTGENRLNEMVPMEERLGPGWSHMESWGCWTDGPYVRLDLMFDPTGAALSFKINGNADVAGHFSDRIVRIFADGASVGYFALPMNEHRYQMAFELPPPDSGSRDSLVLEFVIDNPTPYRLEDGTVADARQLGIGVHTIDIEQR